MTNILFKNITIIAALSIIFGCAASKNYVNDADTTATEIITDKQLEALGKSESFTIETPKETLRRRLFAEQNLLFSHPESVHGEATEIYQTESSHEQKNLTLSLVDALGIAARSNRQYQTAKENVFLAALALDLERDVYRSTISALLSSEASTDLNQEPAVEGIVNSAIAGVSKKLKSGAEIAAQLTLDLVKLMTMDRSAAFGLLADATISIPLLRGARKEIETEPLTQAERDVIYSIWEFERFKKTFAVTIASDFLFVLQQLDQVSNSRDNYRSLVASAQRTRRLADAGRLPEVQVDQTIQDELKARSRYISALQSYGNLLDSFKIKLGLPPDSSIELKKDELNLLVQEILSRSSYSNQKHENDVAENISRHEETYFGYQQNDILLMALNNRLDLKIAHGRVEDAQRVVVVASNQLHGDLNLLLSGSSGERRTLSTADQPDSSLQIDSGNYAALLSFDLPLERTSERNALRENLIDLQKRIRDFQGTEDQIKLDVYNRLRELKEYNESLIIQSRSVEVAERQVKSTEMFLQAGRIQVRELLEAREDLITAQNGLSAAVVNYRIAELALQRDIGILQVDSKGLWKERAILNKKTLSN